MKIIKTWLEGVKRAWLDELPGVLWAYRTTVRTSTGVTPFKLAYGSETVIPIEVHMVNHRVMTYQDKDNEEQLHLSLDLIDEVRTDAKQRTVRYKNLMARQYDAMVKPRQFNVRDLVLVSLATKNPAHGKLDLIGNDLIELSTTKGKDPTTWRPWTGGNWSILGMLNT